MSIHVPKETISLLIERARQKGSLTLGEARSLLDLEPAEVQRVVGYMMERGWLVCIPALPKSAAIHLTVPEFKSGFAFFMRKRTKAGKPPMKTEAEKEQDKIAKAGRRDKLPRSTKDERVQDVLFELEMPGTVAEIAESMGRGRDSVKRAIDVLEAEGKLFKATIKTGQRGRPLILWGSDQGLVESEAKRRSA